MKLSRTMLLSVPCLLAVAGGSCGSKGTATVVAAPAPAVETLAVEMAAAEPPAAEKPAAEEPKAEEQVTEKKAVEKPATQETLPAAREVLDHFVEVTKMKSALEKTSSMHLTGKFAMASMGLEGATEVWSGKPDRRLVSVEMGAFGTMLVGYDGKVAWSTHPMMGARLLKGTELLQLKLEACYDSALKPDARYELLRTVGRATFDQKECYELELVAKPLDGMDPEKTRAARTTHEFYEIATGFLIGTKGKQEGELGGGPFTQTLSDYKDWGGQLMATKVRVEQSSQEVTMTFTDVEFDTATDKTFAPPAEIQKMLEAAAAKEAAKPK